MSPSSLPQDPFAVTDSIQAAVAPDTTQQGGTVAPADTSFIDIGQINNAFGRAIGLFLEGRFEEMYHLLYGNLINVTGLLLANGIKAFLAFFILYVIYRALDSGLDQVLTRSTAVDAGLQSLLQRTYRVVAYLFIGIIVLSQLGMPVTTLVAGIGVAGIAVGLAARDSLENFISGVTILIDRPFSVGDFIEVDDQFGRVHEITLRSTRIQTVRNEIIVMPNTQMITQQLINHTKQNTLRVDIPFGIAYKEFPEEARQVVLRLPEGDDRILSRPEPTVIVNEMADSSVNMALRFYLRDPTQEVPMRWEYTEKVREALREADIEVPFPHRQLFLDEAKAFADAPFMQKRNGGEEPPDNESDAS